MAFSMHDMLRWFMGGDKKEKSASKSEREAYDFCRNAYKRSGGVSPELRRVYEQYLKQVDDGCEFERGTTTPSHRADKVESLHSRV